MTRTVCAVRCRSSSRRYGWDGMGWDMGCYTAAPERLAKKAAVTSKAYVAMQHQVIDLPHNEDRLQPTWTSSSCYFRLHIQGSQTACPQVPISPLRTTPISSATRRCRPSRFAPGACSVEEARIGSDCAFVGFTAYATHHIVTGIAVGGFGRVRRLWKSRPKFACGRGSKKKGGRRGLEGESMEFKDRAFIH